MDNETGSLIDNFYYDGEDFAMTITDTGTLKKFFNGESVNDEYNLNTINRLEQATSQQTPPNLVLVTQSYGMDSDWSITSITRNNIEHLQQLDAYQWGRDQNNVRQELNNLQEYLAHHESQFQELNSLGNPDELMISPYDEISVAGINEAYQEKLKVEKEQGPMVEQTTEQMQETSTYDLLNKVDEEKEKLVETPEKFESAINTIAKNFDASRNNQLLIALDGGGQGQHYLREHDLKQANINIDFNKMRGIEILTPKFENGKPVKDEHGRLEFTTTKSYSENELKMMFPEVAQQVDQVIKDHDKYGNYYSNQRQSALIAAYSPQQGGAFVHSERFNYKERPDDVKILKGDVTRGIMAKRSHTDNDQPFKLSPKDRETFEKLSIEERLEVLDKSIGQAKVVDRKMEIAIQPENRRKRAQKYHQQQSQAGPAMPTKPINQQPTGPQFTGPTHKHEHKR